VYEVLLCAHSLSLEILDDATPFFQGKKAAFRRSRRFSRRFHPEFFSFGAGLSYTTRKRREKKRRELGFLPRCSNVPASFMTFMLNFGSRFLGGFCLIRHSARFFCRKARRLRAPRDPPAPPANDRDRGIRDDRDDGGLDDPAEYLDVQGASFLPSVFSSGILLDLLPFSPLRSQKSPERI